MISIPLPYILLEISAFFLIASRVGFGTTFLAYALPSFLGFFILAFQSRSAFFNLQAGLAQGRQPGPQLLNTAAKFISGILLIVPFIGTRLLGILLFLPGTRHLILFMFQAWIFKRFAGSVFRQAGANAGPGFHANFRSFRFDGQTFHEDEVRVERDAEVVDIVDVTPLEIEHHDSRL